MNNDQSRPQDMTETEIESILYLVNQGEPWKRYIAVLKRLRQAERDTCENPPASMSERILGQHQGRSLQLKDVLNIPDEAQQIFNSR